MKPRGLYLQADERAALEQRIKSGRRGARELARARVLLLLDRSQDAQRTLAQVAEACLVTAGTVSNIKRRYEEGGIARALYDLPLPGALPKMTGEVEAHLIALACSQPPVGRERWRLRLLADELVALEVVDSVSHVTVGEVLKKTR